MACRIRTILLLFSGCWTLACSTSNEFVVVNHSNDPVEVTYSLKECTEDFHFPGKLTTEEFEEKQDWRFLNEIDSKFNSQTCSFEVELKADEVLFVQRAYNYSSESEKEKSERFKLKSISVKGKHGRISLEGMQIEKHFVNESGKYLMTYK